MQQVERKDKDGIPYALRGCCGHIELSVSDLLAMCGFDRFRDAQYTIGEINKKRNIWVKYKHRIGRSFCRQNDHSLYDDVPFMKRTDPHMYRIYDKLAEMLLKDENTDLEAAEPVFFKKFYNESIVFKRAINKIMGNVRHVAALRDAGMNDGDFGEVGISKVIKFRFPRGILSIEIRGRVDAYNAKTRVLYEIKGRKNPQDIDFKQVMVYWSLLRVEKAFLIYRFGGKNTQVPVEFDQRAVDEVWRGAMKFIHTHWEKINFGF